MKEEKDELYEIEETSESEKKFLKKINNIRKVFSVFISLLIFFVAISIIKSTKEPIIIVFAACVIVAGLIVLAQAFDKDILAGLLSKLYVIIFLTLWFGFLGFATYGVLNGQGDKSLLFLIIPFFLVGIYTGYKYLIKK